jgi:hypothetical protein
MRRLMLERFCVIKAACNILGKTKTHQFIEAAAEKEIPVM